MKLSYIKYFTLAILLLISFNTLFAQNTRTEYFMETAYSRNNMNPALRPDQGYLVVPVIPTISFGAETNTFNLDHFTFKSGNERVTFMHKDITNDQFLSGIKNDNYLSTDVSAKLFGFGFYKGNAFWNIDLRARIHADVNLPKSAFELLKVGFDPNRDNNYDLSEIATTGNAFAELGVSYSRPFLSNNLVVGIRPKLLVGFVDFDLAVSSLNIRTTSDAWHAKSQVKLKGAAPGVTATYDEDGLLDGFDLDGFAPAGYGGAIDLGAVYDFGEVLPILKGLKLSAAINDLGFIAWSKKNSLTLSSPETEVTVKNEGNIDNSSLEEVLDDAFTKIKDAVNLTDEGESANGYTRALNMNMNIGAEYEILKNKLSVGALYSTRFGHYYTSKEFTGSINYRPLHWLATSVSYSAIHSKFDTFGFAFHIAPSKGLNLFVASDFILPHVNSDFVPTTMKGINAQIGVSIPIGGKISRKKCNE